MQLLGIEDLRFHDLRHEGISRLFENGKNNSAGRVRIGSQVVAKFATVHTLKADRR